MTTEEPGVSSGDTPDPVQQELDRSGTVADTVAELTGDDLAPEERRRLLRRLAGQTAKTWKTVWRPKEAVSWLTSTATDIAPYITVRDLATLRRHHPDLTGDALAERLIRNAARTTAGIGMAGGGIATVEWAAPPTLLTAPVLLTAETLAVVAVELKLIGELHEVYNQPIPGTGTQRATAMLAAWAGRRGVNPLSGVRGMAAVLGTTARKELRDRIAKRFGRNLTTLGPLLSGAAVAGYLNRRATRQLGDAIRKDLGRRAIEG
ncbi:hypothetical protein Lfu02_46480 [Longispora fulva]|uniref:EcsC family protein n=1 Tax=Longispora fulva TaxID=619741 RepID=A0A8J7GK03_9ACTN|nr:hypothetical protein [Longispora fulva]MBG6138023.1 hypothetical protein [Longispora fulva]GIG60276.1 hypothetical protein Lfu02_46480 [Longispora fulva]